MAYSLKKTMVCASKLTAVQTKTLVLTFLGVGLGPLRVGPKVTSLSLRPAGLGYRLS